LRRLAAHRHGRRHADEDQGRREQEAAADAEQAGKKPREQPKRQQRQRIDGHFSDRKVKFHSRSPAWRDFLSFCASCGPGSSLASRAEAIGRCLRQSSHSAASLYFSKMLMTS
jgi:hypothetical protein